MPLLILFSIGQKKPPPKEAVSPRFHSSFRQRVPDTLLRSNGRRRVGLAMAHQTCSRAHFPYRPPKAAYSRRQLLSDGFGYGTLPVTTFLICLARSRRGTSIFFDSLLYTIFPQMYTLFSKFFFILGRHNPFQTWLPLFFKDPVALLNFLQGTSVGD